MSHDSLLLLISGPAGSGKTTLCDRLLEEFASGLQRVITTTTRLPREGEVDGVDYHFLDKAEFLHKVDAGEFYEYARVHSGYYGTQKSAIREQLNCDMDLILNIDVQGAASFRKIARSDTTLAGQLVTVFIQPASIDQIRERLLHRGKDTSDEIERRLITAEQEMTQKDFFDHVIISGTKEADYEAFRHLYLSNREGS